MKKVIASILFMVVLLISSCNDHSVATSVNSRTEDISTSVASETNDQLPTPIPTYAPGTELYGMLSVSGEVVIEPKYEYLDLFSEEGLARFKDHGLWGFVNTDGEEVIPAQYEGVNSFSEGLAAVKVDGLWGFIDVSGKMVIESKFMGIEGGFKSRRCIFQEGILTGLIDEQGQIVLKPSYSTINLYSNEHYIVNSEEKDETRYGVIDRDGELVVEMKEDEIYAVTDSGYYFVLGSDQEGYNLMFDFLGNKKFTIKYSPDMLSMEIRSNSLLAVSEDGEKWGLFDLSSGTHVLDECYDELWYIPGNLHAEIYLDGQRGIVELSSKKMTLGIFDNDLNSVYFGCFLFENHDRYGVKRLDGTIILEANYIWIDILSENEFYVVTKDKKRHIINERGTIIREIEGSVFPSEYVYSIECWGVFFEDYSEEQGIKHNDGFLSKDGETIVAIKCMPSRINDDCAIQYPNPIDLKTAPAIYSISKSDGTGGIGIMNPLNEPDPIVYAEYSWFPDQKVLVVSDRDGNNGLVCYDSTVLFELQDCHIFTNTGLTVDQNDPYVYETYNDTDYLIYTVKAK